MFPKNSFESFCVKVLGVLLTLLVFHVTGAKAQAVNTATISGSVTDTSGAAVIGAMVSVKNSGTGVTNTTVTDTDGRYIVPNLVIGTYEVDVTAAGFKKAIHGGITLTIGTQTVVDATLEVGTIQQTVTVEADVSHVETTSVAVTNLVEQAQMVDLPLNGRNYQSLISLAPGVVPTPAGQFGQAAQYVVGGSRQSGQAYLLDGSNTTAYWNNGTGSSALGTALGIDSIAEFNLLMNNYSAQYGGAGVVMNATTKSGTNSFHGTVYEYIRNSAWEASNNYIPSAFTLPATVLDRNQFGGSLGGPIKKDKAFFFVNYEGFRQHTASQVLMTTPDLAARGCSGMTVQQCQALGGVNVNGTPVVNGKQIPFPACNAASAYPGANPCTAALNIESILSLMPIGTQADNPSTGIADSFGTYTQRATENFGMARFDYTVSDKDSLFMRFTTDTARLDIPEIVQVDPGRATSGNTYASIQERRIFSPTLFNSISFSYVRPVWTYSQYASPTITQIGSTPVPTYADCQGCPANQPLMFFPADNFLRETGTITNIVGSASQTFGVAPSTNTGLVAAAAVTPFYYYPNHFTLTDDVVWTKGAHGFKIGMSIQRNRDNTFNPVSNSGGWTPSPVSGTQGSLAGFLSGTMASATGMLPSALLAADGLPGADSTYDSREWIYAPYIQDDWKVTSRLTLNLGLRYSPTNDIGIVNHVNGQLMNAPFPDTYGSPVTTTVSGGTTDSSGPYPSGTNCLNAAGQFNGTPGALLGCGWVPVSHVTANNVSLRNIDPRVGVAWDPFKDHKTSVRAGFGFFHEVLTARDFDYWDNPPGRIGTTVSMSPALAGGPEGYPFILSVPIGGNCVSTTNPPWQNCQGGGPGVYYGQTNSPYMMQWNANIQREILPETILTLGYTGSRGVHLTGVRNEDPPSACGGTDPINGQYILSTTSFVNGAYIPCPNLNPAYGTLSFTNATFNSWYEGGTISLNRRLTHGLQAQLGYTRSKSIDTSSSLFGGEIAVAGMSSGGSGGPDPYNQGIGKGPSAFNRDNNVRFSAIYTLPFQKNMLVSGWQLNGIYSYVSGFPFSPTGLAQGTPGNWPNYVAGCNLYTGATPQQAVNFNLSGPQAGLATNPYINGQCFSLQPVGEFGNLGRDALTGPSNWDLDMSLIKDTRITKVSENFVVEFRAEFFNILNHPSWSVPTGLTLWTYNTTGGINNVGTLQPGNVQANFGEFGQPSSTPREIQFGLRASF